MSHVYSFEKMTAWQLARQMAKQIYLKSKPFPKEELFGITSQIRRAVISICCNLAEGSARLGTKSQNYFYQIAYGSAVEVINLLIICTDLEYLSEAEYNSLRDEIEKLTFHINKLASRGPDNLAEPDIPYDGTV